MQTITEADYLAFEETSQIKHEFLNGEIFAMSGGSENHSLISASIQAALLFALKGKGCRVYESNMRLQVAATGLYTYPDAMVVCGETQLVENRTDTLLNPIVIIEVLSPSTEK